MIIKNTEASLNTNPELTRLDPFLTALTPLFGKRVDDKDVLAFLEEQGFKRPSKFTVTPNNDRIYVSDKKKGVELLFSMSADSPLYPEIRGPRKNSYIPVLTTAFLSHKYFGTLPFELSTKMTYKELEQKFGEPDIVSLHWTDDDGNPQFTRWEPVVEREKDVVFSIEWWNGKGITMFRFGIKSYSCSFYLYDPWSERSFLEKDSSTLVKPAVFIEWAISRDKLKETPENIQGIRDVKAGVMNGIDFILTYCPGNRIWSNYFDLDILFITLYLGSFTKPFSIGRYDDDFIAVFRSQRHHLPASVPENDLSENGYPYGPVYDHYLTLYKEGKFAGLANIVDNRLKDFESHGVKGKWK